MAKRAPEANDPLRFPGGETWVDREYDPHFGRQMQPERPSRLKAAVAWAKEKLFGPLITGLLLALVGAVLNYFL